MYKIHLFETKAQKDAKYTFDSEDYIEPWVSYTREDESVDYNLPPIDWSSRYLTLRPTRGNCTFAFSREYSYSIDDGETWVSRSAGNATPNISKGQKIMFKAVSTPTNYYGCGTFSTTYSTGLFEVMGNPYSMFCGDNFREVTSLPDYACSRLFSGCRYLVSAYNLSLPATTLSDSCYSRLFEECSALTSFNASTLSATTLARYCYGMMFYNCKSLKKPPKLPATTLAPSCYANMFWLSGIETPPNLPATILAQSCYQGMFENCVSLTRAPELPATTVATSAYTEMFTYCTSLTTPPQLPATELFSGCYGYMFSACTSLTTPPQLPATTLAQYCYYKMFAGCTSLTIAPELTSNTLIYGCYESMFVGCTSLTTAPDLPATSLSQRCYYGMFSGCSSLNYIKAMFTTTPSTAYSMSHTTNWVSGVASTGTFVKNSAATWDVSGVNGVPSNWTVIDENGNPWVAPT